MVAPGGPGRVYQLPAVQYTAHLHAPRGATVELFADSSRTVRTAAAAYSEPGVDFESLDSLGIIATLGRTAVCSD